MDALEAVTFETCCVQHPMLTYQMMSSSSWWPMQAVSACLLCAPVMNISDESSNAV